jgi:hypothetical protein
MLGRPKPSVFLSALRPRDPKYYQNIITGIAFPFLSKHRKKVVSIT